MAEKFVIKAEKRESRGSNAARRLRREGKIPVTIYGGGGDAVAATAEVKHLAAIIRSDSGANTLFTLEMPGEEDARVIFQDRQIDPVHSRMVHADLRRLSKGEKIELTVPISLVGSPAGVRNEGGLLEQMMREVRVLCTPSNIPESIEVDVEAREVNESISVSGLVVDDEIEILENPEATVAAVVIVKEVELETPEEDELADPSLFGDDEAAEGEGDSEGDSEDGAE